MSNAINERIEGTNQQAKAIEMPSSMRMIELSKTYLVSIEKKFGTFLHKLGIDIGNYDGNLSGNKTGAEKIFKEKILPLQEKIQKEKHILKKHELMTQLTQAVLQARGMDMGEIQKITRENGKEAEFQKESNKLLGNNEYTKLQQELQKEVSRLDDVYVVEGKKNTEEILAEIRQSNLDAIQNVALGKISQEEYLKIIEHNNKIAQDIGAQKEMIEQILKTFELSMRSGATPVLMMAFTATRKLMPALPVVIGGGMYARWYHDTLQNEQKGLGEKSWETTKMASYTVASIAPISGSVIAVKEAYESWEKLKDGTGTKSEAIADTIGAGVSIIFDGVTIVMAATGVGAVPAAGVATGRKAAVEGTKFGIKKFISKAGDIFETGRNAFIDLKNSGKALIGFKSTVDESGKIIGSQLSGETARKVWTELAKDTIRGTKDILTFKGARDIGNNLLFKTPLGIGDAYKKLRPTKFSELRNIGIAAKIPNLEDKGINRELESIDSKKHSLTPETTKELLDSLEIKMSEIANNSKKLKRLQDKISTEHTGTRGEEEIKKLKQEIENASTITNKIFDILDYRARQISQNPNTKDEAGNQAMWEVLHKNLKTYLTNQYISSDIKMNILQGIRPSSIRGYGYLKKDTELKDQITGRSNSIEKLATDVFTSQNSVFEQKAKLLLLLSEKGILQDIHISKDGKNMPISQMIDPFLRETNGKILIENSYFLNRLFSSIPNLNTQKNLINKISDNIRDNFQNDPKNDTTGQFIASIDFLHTHGTLNRVMTSPDMQNKLASYIESISPEKFNMRGTFNMIDYFKGTSLEQAMTLKQKELEKAGILGKNFKFPEGVNKNSLSKNIKKLEEKINNNVFHIQDIKNLLENTEKVLFSHKEIVDLFQKHNDELRTPEVIELIRGKFNSEDTHIEVKNLLGKILGSIDHKNIILTLKEHISPENIILFANQKEINSGSLINMIDGLKESKSLSIFDRMIAMDILKNHYALLKESKKDGDKSFCNKYENFIKNNDNRIDTHIIDSAIKSDTRMKHAISLAEKWGMELKVDYTNGHGVYFVSKENGNIIPVDFSQMSNIRSDFLDIVVSHAPLSNGKYFENIGRVNYVALKTKFDEKIESSEHQVFGNILGFNRVLQGLQLGDNGYKQLLGEYHIESFGERFIKKIILAEHLVANGKSDLVFDSLKADINNPKISGEIKMSLVHNIQDVELRDKLFQELIAGNALSIKDYQHDLFKKLAFKIDNETINTNVVNNIFNIKADIMRGEKLEAFDGLISIIQQSKHISGTSEKVLMDIFREIKGKINKINADNINEHYMKLLIEFGRFEYLRDQPEILNTLSSNIQSRHKSDPLMSKALEYGLGALKRYHNFDNVRFGEAGIKGLKELKSVIEKKISILGVQSSDLFETKEGGLKVLKFDESNIGELGKELITGLKDIGVSPTQIIGNELYVKIDGTGKELSFTELIVYKEALVKLKGIQKDIVGVKAGDIFDENMSAYKDILKKAGFDIQGYVDYKKTGKIPENINNETRDFIQTTINKNSGAIQQLDNQVKGVVNNEIINTHETNNTLNTQIDPKQLGLPDEVITQLQKTEKGGNIINLKTILVTLVTLKLMTPTEAQAAAQEIGDRWTSSPEYKEYQRLGGEKSAAARAIKEKAITEITRQVLSVYIQSFDAKYQELMDRKVKELPIGLQVLLGNIDIKLKERIKPGYDSMTISKLNTHIFNFVDSIYKGKGLAEKNLNDIVTKFPELGGTKIIESLIELGKNSDRGVKWDELNEEQRKISEMIKKM